MDVHAVLPADKSTRMSAGHHYFSPRNLSSMTSALSEAELIPQETVIIDLMLPRLLVVCRFWSHFGCLGRKVTKYAHSGIA